MKSKFILSIIIEQCLILCILIIHLSGFMNVSQVSNVEKNTSSINIEKFVENTNNYNNYKNEPLGKKTVLLIIDALRADHLVDSQVILMEYCTELLRNKRGIGYMLKTASPTVTLPRIKSIVTGSIPSFMDVIFNFAAKQIVEENVVSSAHKKSLRIKFFGDETWLKLYPKTFTQYDAVTSFFVSDYTEGEPYLFLISGDHGMSDIGGHGGDSHSEIWTSVFVMSNLLDDPTTFSLPSSAVRFRSQVDLASTLALFLGVDIPANNVGFPLFEFLEPLPLEKQLVAHYRVAKQLMHLARNRRDHSTLDLTQSQETSIICLPTVVWTLFLSTDISSPIYEKKMLFITIVGGVILFVFNSFGFSIISPVSYIIFVLFTYGVCNLFSFAKCFTADFQMKVSSWNIAKLFIIVGVILYPFSLLATSFVEEEHFIFYFIISMIYFTLLVRVVLNFIHYKFSESSHREKRHEVVANVQILKLDYPMAVPSLYNADLSLHFMMSEKKEQGIILSDGTNDKRFASNFIIIFISWCIFRLLRSFNATGDKWKDLIHLNQLLRESDGNEILICILIGLVIVLLLYRHLSPVLVFLILTGIFGRHVPFFDEGVKSGLFESHLVYFGLFIFIFYNCIKVFYYNKIYIKKHEYDNPLVDAKLVLYLLQVFEIFFGLLFLLLQKPENVLVTSLSLLHMHLIIPLLIQNWESLGLTRMQVYIIALWIGQASFFIHGNSNSCLLCKSMLVLLELYMCIRCWWMLQLLTLTVYVINVTLQRHHLFIWSVFAPKLLYEECNFLCLMILTVIVYLFIKITNCFSK
ncbi:GPI ethanolamine phosphate transferase 2 [Armadillidium vulgare]|nr:GPI ethanolamine phosphate transferase 2 [Armadillidium vulgare]